MQQPPLLPDSVVSRVQMVARRNGLSIVFIAGLAALLKAAGHDTRGAIACLLATGAGLMEMHGGTLLQRHDPRGVGWMIRGELCLLFVILGYCTLQLLNPNFTEMQLALQAALKLDWFKAQWAEIQRLGITEDEYLRMVHVTSQVVLALVSVGYQGGMALYYSLKRKRVELALAEEEPEV
jgi:hypothetical protein